MQELNICKDIINQLCDSSINIVIIETDAEGRTIKEVLFGLHNSLEMR